MPRDHFAKLYQTSSHRHDQPNDGDQFNKDMKVLTGMLYSIVKAPIKPFIPAFYKTAKEYQKDYEPIYNAPQDCPCGCPPNNCTCCCSKAEGCGHRK